MTPAVNERLRRDYAPTGVLRVALNHGNRVLVSRSPTGAPEGISVDIAHRLANAIDCDLRLVEFERAIDVSSSAERNLWDVCFLAIDPQRAATIAFTAPYVRISGCYIAAAGVDVADGRAVVSRALRVGTVEGSAYTLFLTRQPGAENLVLFPDIGAAFEALDAGAVDCVAGIEQAMAVQARDRPGSRVLQPAFMDIQQAMGLPVGRPLAVSHLRNFIAGLAQGGTIGGILERHGISADSVLPTKTE